MSNRVDAPEASLTGERKHVTVLFADIVGSTALIRGLDPEQSASILDPILREMAAIVGQQAGFVARLTGDGIKALFGVPTAREDHALRACAAALAIRAMTRTSRHRVRVRVGVHTGEVMVRPLQAGERVDYDAVGMVVHLAARLEQLAQPGRICLSGTTARLVSDRFNVRPIGTGVAKGIRGTIDLFELLSSGNQRARWDHRSREGLGIFVGRESELATLLNAIRAGGQAITVLGGPGLGKSRLIFEALRRRDFAGWTILKIEIEANDAHAGLRPFARMLRTWLRVSRQDTPARIRAKLDQRLAPIGGLSATDIDALRALLDVPVELAGDSAQQAAIVTALCRLFGRVAMNGRTLLVVEDAHWLDEDGLELLRHLDSEAASTGLAIVRSSRPAGPAPVGERTIVLAPLSTGESGRLLDAILDANSEHFEVKAQIVARADGIPLFLEEMARFLHRLPDAAEPESVIPESIQAIIAERIDRLPTTGRDVLRIASVVGREVPMHLLHELIVHREIEPGEQLHLLEQQGFIRLVTARGEPMLVFSHVLTREVAYAGILRAERRAIHGAVVAAYETLYPTRLEEHLELLGTHANEACLWHKAETYSKRAAQKAIDRSNHSKAIMFTRNALHALGQCDLDAISRAKGELELRLLLRIAFNAIGNYRERLGNLDRAEELAITVGQRAILPSLWVSRASVALQLGHVDDAIRLCTRARRSALGMASDKIAMDASYALSRGLFYKGQLAASLFNSRHALELFREKLGSAWRGSGFGSPEVMLLTQLAQTFACLGRFNDGLRCAAEALSIAERLQRGFDIALASYGFGVVHLYADRSEDALKVLESGMQASLSDGAQSIYAPLGGLLAYSRYRRGQTDESLALCQRVLSYSEGSFYYGNWPRLFASMIRSGTGDADGALQLARTARAVAGKRGYRMQLVWSDLLLARLYRATNCSAAMRHNRGALIASRQIRSRPCLAWALAEMAQLHQVLGRDDTARDFQRKGSRIALAIRLGDRIEATIDAGPAANSSGTTTRRPPGQT